MSHALHCHIDSVLRGLVELVENDTVSGDRFESHPAEVIPLK